MMCRPSDVLAKSLINFFGCSSFGDALFFAGYGTARGNSGWFIFCANFVHQAQISSSYDADKKD
jgi:hypothetical protein